MLSSFQLLNSVYVDDPEETRDVWNTLSLSLFFFFYIEHINTLPGHRAWRKLLYYLCSAQLYRLLLFFSLTTARKQRVKMITENNSIIDIYDRETDALLQEIQRYYTPILVLLGLLGNSLSVYVFFGTKLRYSSSSIYLGALAISDSGFLVAFFVPWLTMVYVDLFNRWGFCQFFTYLGTLCSFLSVWLVVAFTVERYVAVKWPLRRQFLCTVARAKMTVMELTALAVLLSTPVLLFTNVKNNICTLNLAWQRWANAYNILDTVMTFVVPLTMIVIFNTLIARNIYKLDHIRRTLTIESDASNDRTHTPRDRMPQTKVTKMLLIVSTAFFCLNMPTFVLRVVAYVSIFNTKVCINLFNAKVKYRVFALKSEF